MDNLIILFSTTTIVVGIIIVINPEPIFGLLSMKSKSLCLHILAVFLRIMLGIALVIYAPESKYPTAILILGYISIIAGAFLAEMGRTNFWRLMLWAHNFSHSFGRIVGFLAILFGGFLFHAVVWWA